jgi:hypothetical protein
MITILTILVILQAVSHGLNTRGNKDAGHLINSLFLALFLLMPFMFHLNWQQLPAYLAGYVGLRVLLYDYMWNLAAGQSWWHQGQSHWHGRFFSKWPAGFLLFSKIVVSIGLITFYFRNI